MSSFLSFSFRQLTNNQYLGLTYIQQTGDPLGDAGDKYIGLDRFGRVVDQRWVNLSSVANPTDRFQYGYDRDSNRL